ncbi:uncharacterized protein LACBIDRAFT_301311 [Laccaria bicolor S238N-H82]|uniref:Predicted protein n=1 Tax=Laccaria bicolor (strain S238N-H82 / ATCC MYA-4686) TaxID=486041 RepID=B0CN88_LACBS|nr:uncharacterized protein LACBIDRAFT_301311 [Laccaria bicolor S238N-H82]EDR15260.1 predicted protein [Laccaria bicolor S238N-H82]|eukprot:XP_001873468.1 predicted protein [Laccaria bicolor S238N-H82]
MDGSGLFSQNSSLIALIYLLTHNVHGPHDDKFYKFLSGLQDEYDALQRSGYAGEGFFSKGPRPSKRRRTSRVLGSGGRLGEQSIRKGRLPCSWLQKQLKEGHATKSRVALKLARREAEKAAREGIENKVIHLTLDDDSDSDVIIVEDVPRPIAGPSSSSASKRQVGAAPNSGSSSKLKATPVRNDSMSNQRPRASSPPARSNSEWACQICTLLNQPFALQCDACETKRPQERLLFRPNILVERNSELAVSVYAISIPKINARTVILTYPTCSAMPPSIALQPSGTGAVRTHIRDHIPSNSWILRSTSRTEISSFHMQDVSILRLIVSVQEIYFDEYTGGFGTDWV